MWLEVDGHALIVHSPDAILQSVIDAIPLCLSRGQSELPTLGTLSLRTCSPEELRARAEVALGGAGQRLLLAADSSADPIAEVLVRPTEALMFWPDQGLATIILDEPRAEVMVADPGGLPAAILAAAAVQAIIAERGFSPIHASLVDRDGMGVMFCGERSRGKTSSCLAMARAGWTVRADDRCFLRMCNGLPTVWGPGGEMRLRPNAPDLWPDVSDAMARGRARGEKRVVPLTAVGGRAAAGSVTNPTLMFPQVDGSGRHRMERMPPAEALSELLFSTGLAALPAHAARQFHDLTALLDQVPCYRLILGRDMDELPQLIPEAMA